MGLFNGLQESIDEAIKSIIGATKVESEIDTLLEHAPSVIAEADAVVEALLDRLTGTYEFEVFPAGSVNYGLLVTHRQEWSPVTYQVGRLAETIPLAPRQRREIKVTTTRKLHENRKTVSSQTRESTREQSVTRRLEAEAVEAASTALNNQISANGSFNIGVGSIGASSQFTSDLKQETKRLHKSFSEMAQKAVDSLREQVEVTVETTVTTTDEVQTTTTLENPNDELTVTYLLYELERRYRVLTEINRVRPVVLYAMPVPQPSEIDADWILRHGWIIRDALLDTTLVEVLDDLEEIFSSVALDYEIRRSALIEQRRTTTTLLQQFLALERSATERREQIVALMQGEGEIEAGEASTGERVAAAIFTGGLSELFGGGQSDQDEILESRRKAAEQALEYLNAEIRDKARALDSARDALERATDEFSEVATTNARNEMNVARLRAHIRDNIFHYMHAIWSSQHPDDRFFTIYDDLVPFHTPDPADYTLTLSSSPLDGLPGLGKGHRTYELLITAPDTSRVPATKRRLSDIANVDRPLGFRGNLAVFELRECSQLTDYMAAEYIDPHAGIREPGALTGISFEEFTEYVRDAASTGRLTQEALDGLVAIAVELLEGQTHNADELILPTGQLFMEALPGDTSLLEPFKLLHRGLDVIAAEEGVRAARIDSLRRVRKVAIGELERDPTEVDHFHLGEARDVPHTPAGGGNT